MIRDRRVTEEKGWETIVLTPKEKGKYKGIGIVEMLWKVCSVVVNFRLEKVSSCYTTLFKGSEKGEGRRHWRPS